MNLDRLTGLLSRFEGKRVLVIGDCMLDEYVWGRVDRISPEAPVPVVEQLETTYAAGGASNVAVNVVAMDGAASIITVTGDDAMGARLREELGRRGVQHDGVITQSDRPTTVKTRIISQGHQLLRVDREHRAPISDSVTAQLIDRVAQELPGADAVLLSDYQKGVISETLIAEVLSLARKHGKPVTANPKPSNTPLYRGVSLISLNRSEAEAVTRLSLADAEGIDRAGQALLKLCGCEAAIITLGGRGLALFEAGEPGRHLPVVPLEVFDPCGCGDSAIAAATLARSAGAEWVDAAALANLAGNAKVRKLGVVPVTRKEIEQVYRLGNGHSKEA